VRRQLLLGLSLALAGVGLSTGCKDDDVPTEPVAPGAEPGDLSAENTQAIPDRYIVVLKDDVPDAPGEAQRQVAAVQGQLHFTFTHALKGYAATLPPAALAALRANPMVRYIEPDRRVKAVEATQTPTPSWGMDRVDQRDLPLDNGYSYTPRGAGVRIYIIDTGIRLTHIEFQPSRAIAGAEFVGDGNGTNDCHGHGTHVAGTAGGTSYGIAKAATVVAVRVLDCGGFGSASQFIAGVDWVTAHAQRPAVANASVHYGFVQAINDAVTRSIDSGVVYAAAAANDQADACHDSPGGTLAALSVAASNSADARAWFSNWGTCVDLFAPGENITSAWSTSDNATNTISGTSMASPHVAGAAALYLEQHPSATPAQVMQAIRSNATPNKISNPMGTPNLLLYTAFMNTAPGGSWATRAAVPTARRNHAVAVASGLIYAIGGLNSSGGVLKSVQAYNPTGNTWSTKAPLPASRQGGDGAATISGRIYVAGGQDAAGALTRTLYVLNTSTNTWATRANMPVASGCGGSVAISGKLYVFTGCTRSSGGGVVRTGLLHRYDPATNTWTALRAAPEAHEKPAVGVINGKIYVAGGATAAGTPGSRLDVYDPATNTWTTRAAMPTARRNAAGLSFNGKLHALGGFSGSTYLATQEAYDPTTNTWSSLVGMPTARAGLEVGAAGGRLFAIGGRNGTSVVSVNERYTP
jgi:aqualysin 1